MHIDRGNSHQYTLNKLLQLEEHKDLRVIISHELKTPAYCNAAAAKGFRVLWSLRRALKCFDEDMFRIL